MNDKADNSTLTRDTILKALQALSDELGRQGVIGEACLFGGTVMVLAFTARLTTKDVDALFQHLVALYYPANRIPVKTHYLVESMGGWFYGITRGNRIPVKTQYLVEGLFDDGKI